MDVEKAKSLIPPGARPPINPHQQQQPLDHSVWSATFQPPERQPKMGDHHHPHTQPTSVPLTRARSAQHIVNAPPPSRYYYEDYWDDQLYSLNSGASLNEISQPLTAHNAVYPAAENMIRSPPADTLDSSSTRSDTGATMRWSFPEPQIPNYASGTDVGVANPYLDSGLRIPQRKASHRSTLSEGRREFALPFNQSETSLNDAAELLDLVCTNSY